MRPISTPSLVRILFAFLTLAVRPLAATEAPTQPGPEQQQFQVGELRADLDYLFNAIEAVHPAPYAFSKREAIAKERADVEAHFTHPMTRIEFYRLAAPIVADLYDEHTLLSPPGEEIGKLMGNGLLFPVRPLIREDRIFVRTNYSADTHLNTGSEILAIDGESSAELLGRLSRLAVGRNPEHRLALIEKFFNILLSIGRGYESPFDVKVRQNGEIFHKRVNGVLEALIQEKDKRGKAATGDQPLSYRILEDQKTAFVDIRVFGRLKETSAFLDSTFADLKKKNVRTLIIDLRNNDGGFMGASDLLLSYVSPKPVAQLSGAQSKVSAICQQFLKAQTDIADLPPYYQDGAKAQLTAQPGRLLTFSGNVVVPNPLTFTGKIYVLIGRFTYSSASLFAATVKDNHLATLAGEETGGTGTQYGDPCPFELPNTKLGGIIAHTLLVRGSGVLGGLGVPPDIRISETSADIPDGKDVVLEHLLNVIHSGRQGS